MSYIYSNTHQSMCSKAVLLNIFRRFRLLVQPFFIQWSTNEQNKLFYNPPTPSKPIDSLFILVCDVDGFFFLLLNFTLFDFVQNSIETATYFCNTLSNDSYKLWPDPMLYTNIAWTCLKYKSPIVRSSHTILGKLIYFVKFFLKIRMFLPFFFLIKRIGFHLSPWLK